MLVLDELGDLDDAVDGGQNPLLPSAYDAIFSVVLVVIVLTAVLIVVLAVLRAVRLRKAGIDPLSTEGELTAHALRGDLPTAARTLEARLAELDELARRGLITADEHATARRDLLGRG
ncbi:hypothetical protein ACFT5B_09825 [Luteimicrobium sp. NPDC057192]|uniref:hypothetical protein n=1 Tax=Luteimicrobium sp. NPDC057192 TaxID=3346042 RepID=UPI0036312F92